mmetsp:Transcript_37868/g.73336  ORF Transcript_37868/g.73336 Transcript_37868/m.73336 type:complete len:255 (+) Transcript_37868:683-1447(+)
MTRNDIPCHGAARARHTITSNPISCSSTLLFGYVVLFHSIEVDMLHSINVNNVGRERAIAIEDIHYKHVVVPVVQSLLHGRRQQRPFLFENNRRSEGTSGSPLPPKSLQRGRRKRCCHASDADVILPSLLIRHDEIVEVDNESFLGVVFPHMPFGSSWSPCVLSAEHLLNHWWVVPPFALVCTTPDLLPWMLLPMPLLLQLLPTMATIATTTSIISFSLVADDSISCQSGFLPLRWLRTVTVAGSFCTFRFQLS